MSQFVPSLLFTGQSIKLIEELQAAYSGGATKDINDLIRELSNILTKFDADYGQPLLEFDPVVEGEPPSSAKLNRFWQHVQREVNLLQQNTDIVRAAALFAHNLITTEIRLAQNENTKVNNKLKTLQLFTEGLDSNTMTFGDQFGSMEFADLSLVPVTQRLALFTPGQLTLAQRGDLVNLSNKSKVKVFQDSNGFLGNNQEIEFIQTSTIGVADDSLKYRYKAETSPHNNLTAVIDSRPDTWVEYERYEVSEEDRRIGEYNWEYTDPSGQLIPWAEGPSGGVLKFGLEFDLGSLKAVNIVTVLPFGLENDKNLPFVIQNIVTSPNGIDWTAVNPGNVYVGTQVNLEAARTANNVAIGQAVWAFDTRQVRYVRVLMVQPNPISVNVGHTYWVDKDAPSIRVEGPNPSASRPHELYNRMVDGNLLQRRESFIGKRWAIGLREVAIQQVQYQNYGVFVTKPLRPGGVVDRVVLQRADFDVPQSYSSEESWVRFYVSGDDGESWHPISRIEDPFLGIPEQIAFNDPTPAELREPGVGFYTVNREVTSVRLKIEMHRPSADVSTTPVLRSYTLKVRRR